MILKYPRLWRTILSGICLLLLPLAWDSTVFRLHGVGLVLTVALVAGWLTVRTRRAIPFTVPKLIAAMGVYLLLRLISVAFAPLPPYSLETVSTEFALAVLFLFFLDSHNFGWNDDIWLTALFAIAGIVIGLEIILVGLWLVRWTLTTGGVFPLPPVPYVSPGALLSNPNSLAGFLNLAIPFLVFRAFRAPARSAKFGWGVFLILSLAISYFSASRSGWVSLSVGLAGMAGVLWWYRWRGHWRAVLLGGAVVALGGGLAVQQVFFSGKQPLASARFDIWRGAWNLFSESPIFGKGAAAFTPLYAAQAHIPPGFPAQHGHNFVLEMLAENGLVGLAVVFVGLWLVWRAAQSHPMFHRSDTTAVQMRAAFVGAALAAGVHHLGDFILWNGLYVATVMMLVALLVTRKSTAVWTISARKAVFIPTTIFAIALATSLWAARGNVQYERGLAAARADDWATAVEDICGAAKQYPAKTLFSFQCGLASVRLADKAGDVAPISDALPLALDALKRDPYWPVHRANVAMMLWQAGQRENGFNSMQAVAESTPKNDIFALNAGWMAEEVGDNDAARKWYSTAIEINPALANDVFFAMTPLRQSVPGVGEYRSPLANDWDMLSEGLEPIAEMDFTIALVQNPKNAEAWAGLAAAQLGLNDPNAKHSLATAQFISPSHFRVVGTEATFAHFQGDDARAAEIVQNYLKGLTESTLHTNYYSAPYYFGAYNQVGLPFDLLPQFRRPMMDISMQPFIEWLKNYHAAGGTP